MPSRPGTPSAQHHFNHAHQDIQPAQHSTAQHSTAQHSTAQHSRSGNAQQAWCTSISGPVQSCRPVHTVLHSTAQYSSYQSGGCTCRACSQCLVDITAGLAMSSRSSLLYRVDYEVLCFFFKARSRRGIQKVYRPRASVSREDSRRGCHSCCQDSVRGWCLQVLINELHTELVSLWLTRGRGHSAHEITAAVHVHGQQCKHLILILTFYFAECVYDDCRVSRWQNTAVDGGGVGIIGGGMGGGGAKDTQLQNSINHPAVEHLGVAQRVPGGAWGWGRGLILSRVRVGSRAGDRGEWRGFKTP